MQSKAQNGNLGLAGRILLLLALAGLWQGFGGVMQLSSYLEHGYVRNLNLYLYTIQAFGLIAFAVGLLGAIFTFRRKRFLFVMISALFIAIWSLLLAMRNPLVHVVKQFEGINVGWGIEGISARFLYVCFTFPVVAGQHD